MLSLSFYVVLLSLLLAIVLVFAIDLTLSILNCS